AGPDRARSARVSRWKASGWRRSRAESVRKKTYRTSAGMSEMLRGYARRIASSRPPAGTVGIFWLGQAGFVLRGADTTLVVDAFLSPRPDRQADAPVAAEELAFADAFLATHEHRD